MIIDKHGYLARIRHGNGRGQGRSSVERSVYSNNFMVKYIGNIPGVSMKTLRVPKKLIGKWIRLKITIEEMGDK